MYNLSNDPRRLRAGANIRAMRSGRLRLGRPGEKEPAVRQFHHLGIPVDAKMPDMGRFASIKCWATNPDVTHGRVEYLFFEPGSPITEPVLSEPHVAFRVDDLDKEIVGKKCVVGPMTLPEGIKLAFFYVDGCLTEYHQILG